MARDEPAATTLFRAEIERTEKEYAAALVAAKRRLKEEEEDADRERAGARLAVEGRFARQQQAAISTTANEREIVLKKNGARKESAKSSYQNSCWATGAVMDAARTTAKSALEDTKKKLIREKDGLIGLQASLRSLLAQWKQPVADIEAAAEAAGLPDDVSSERTLADCRDDAEVLVKRIQALILPRFLKGKRYALMMGVLWLALVYPLGLLGIHLTGWDRNVLPLLFLGVIGSTVYVAVSGLLGWALLNLLARSRVRRLYQPFCGLLLEATATRKRLLDQAKITCREAVHQAKKQHNHEVRRATARYGRKKSKLEARMAAEVAIVDERFKARQAENEKRRDADLQAAEQRRQARHARAKQRHADELRQIDERSQRRLQELRIDNSQKWSALSSGWQNAMSRLRQVAGDVYEQIRKPFPAWNDPGWQEWTPPPATPLAIQFGSFDLRLDQVPDCMPDDERLRVMTPKKLRMPALCPFPGAPSLLLEAGEEGRAQAVTTLQAVLFRMLTAVPAGKLKCVIIDPVGLGQNFATFMHLADYDKALVTSRIWTEVAHIEQRLTDLTVHMENVIQKYLRNRFADVSEYNSFAGEVAEAFRVLVIANFPVHFSDEAVRRLVSIVQSGPRCGVFTLMSVDTRQPLPKGFDLSDLRSSCTHLLWNGPGFAWQDADFGPYPLTLETAPPECAGQRIVGEGRRSRPCRPARAGAVRVHRFAGPGVVDRRQPQRTERRHRSLRRHPTASPRTGPRHRPARRDCRQNRLR